jgi:acyl carrier protein
MDATAAIGRLVRTALRVELSTSEAEALLATGAMDSLDVLWLAGCLEDEFGILVGERDLTPDNFASVASIATLVEQKLAARQG